MDFQRALDPLGVGGVDAPRGARIHLRKLFMQRRPAALGGLIRQPGAQRRVGGGHGRQAAQQGLEIQPGAAGQDRQPAAAGDVVQRGAGVNGEFGRRVRLPRIANVDQVVRHPASLVQGRLGRADVQAAVHQRRINADDFPAKTARAFKRERGLARRGRAHDGDGGRAWIERHALIIRHPRSRDGGAGQAADQ